MFHIIVNPTPTAKNVTSRLHNEQLRSIANTTVVPFPTWKRAWGTRLLHKQAGSVRSPKPAVTQRKGAYTPLPIKVLVANKARIDSKHAEQ